MSDNNNNTDDITTNQYNMTTTQEHNDSMTKTTIPQQYTDPLEPVYTREHWAKI